MWLIYGLFFLNFKGYKTENRIYDEGSTDLKNKTTKKIAVSFFNKKNGNSLIQIKNYLLVLSSGTISFISPKSFLRNSKITLRRAISLSIVMINTPHK